MSPLKMIHRLKNPTQEYDWGSYSFIQELIGEAGPSKRPLGELWMGAHPKAPSLLLVNEQWISVQQLVARDPEAVLGRSVAQRFSNRFPFLLKVLAVAKPLSIQAHPNQEQAREGFEREEAQRIPLNAPQRNYRDRNPKPELLCALTPFLALNGFRPIREILSLLDGIESPFIGLERAKLRRKPDPEGLKGFFMALMVMGILEREAILSEAVTSIRRRTHEDPSYGWVLKLYGAFPGDMGAFSPLFLNMVRLQPGEAFAVPPGEPHSYLEGAGMELMTNSDNVVRAGLTGKPTDLPELFRILCFEPAHLHLVTPVDHSFERVYSPMHGDFQLSMISLERGGVFKSREGRAVELMICIKGEASIKDTGSGQRLPLKRGDSILVPAAVERYRIEGEATLYKATVPMLGEDSLCRPF